MNDYNELKNIVLNELNQTLSSFNLNEIDNFVNSICKIANTTNKIVGIGAGRMGYGLRAFIMRLNHLGIKAYYMTDTYIPPLTKNDIFIVTSGSGKTKSILNMLEIAISKANPITFAITGDNDSPMALKANNTITFKTSNGGLNSDDNNKKINSIQPMTTLNEQTMFIFFDIITLMIMDKLGIKAEDTKKNHFNVE